MALSFSPQSVMYIAALLFGGTGFIIAHLIIAHAAGDGWQSLPICSGAAAFGLSLLFWRLFYPSDQLLSARRGALVGILTGVLAHPVAWYLAIVWNYASGARTSLGDPVLNPLEGLTGCLVFAFWSLLLTGWITVPAGGILGWILGRTLRSH
jgi:hypothetical protein